MKRKGGKQLEIRKGEMRRRNMTCKGKSTRKEKMRNFTTLHDGGCMGMMEDVCAMRMMEDVWA